jgi:hypothetical protein
MSKSKSSPGRVGRPPAGAGGQRVRDYPQISVRVPHNLRVKLDALTAATGLSRVELIIRAIDCLQRELNSRPKRR